MRRPLDCLCPKASQFKAYIEQRSDKNGLSAPFCFHRIVISAPLAVFDALLCSSPCCLPCVDSVCCSGKVDEVKTRLFKAKRRVCLSLSSNERKQGRVMPINQPSNILKCVLASTQLTAVPHELNPLHRLTNVSVVRFNLLSLSLTAHSHECGGLGPTA